MIRIKTALPVLLATLFLFIACDLKEPVLPTYRLNASIPFAIEKFILGEEIVTNENVTIEALGPDSILSVAINGDIEDRVITADDFSIASFDTSGNFTLGDLRLDSLGTLQLASISLGEIWPELNVLVGQTIVVPDTTIGGLSALVESETFQSITFLSGTARVRLINNLPFTIGPNNSSNGLEATVRSENNPNGDQVQVLFDSPVPSGQTSEEIEDVSGKTLEIPLRALYNFPIVGPFQLTITEDLLNNTGIELEIEIENVQASEVLAKLETQVLDDTINVGYDDETRLREAVIDRGRFFLNFSSFLPLDADVDYIIPALRDAQGQPFRENLFIDANGSQNREVILDGFSVVNPENPGQLIDSLQVILIGQTLAASDLVRVTNRDSIDIVVSSDSLFFESFSGFLGENTLEFDPFGEGDLVDYEDLAEGGIEIAAAELILSVKTDAFIQNLATDLDIRGYHSDENGNVTDSARVLVVNQAINAGNGSGGIGETEIVLSGPEVTQFINILPDSILVSGEVRGSGEATVAVGNLFEADYRFETPIRARINGLAAFESEIDSITSEDINDEVQDAARDDIEDAFLTLRVQNRTPIAGTLDLVVTADPTEQNLYDGVADTSLAIIRQISLDKAPIDPQTGFATDVFANTLDFRLNKREIQLLGNPPLRYGYRVKLDDTGGFVTLRYSDFVTAFGSVGVEVLIREKE